MPSRSILIVAGAIVLLILTCLAIALPGTDDMEIWQRWTLNVRTHGVVRGFEANEGDYSPLATVRLDATSRAGAAVGTSETVAIKISVAVALAVTLALFLAWTRQAFLTLGLWAALLLNSVALGYLDIYTAPFLILSLWALCTRHPVYAVTWLAVASFIKWQPLIVAPLLVAHLVKTADVAARMGEASRMVIRLTPAIARGCSRACSSSTSRVRRWPSERLPTPCWAF